MEDIQSGTDDLERRTRYLEKLNQFYEEYIITVPLSNYIKVEQKQDQQEQ